MLQQNGNNIVNSPSMRCNVCAHCCVSQAAAARAAMSLKFSNTSTQYVPTTRMQGIDSANYLQRPKRDFQIQVR